MIICPTCASPDLVEAKPQSCTNCDWQGRYYEGVLDYLTDDQRSSALFNNYTDNYEELAEINLEKSNIDRTFLKRQAANLIDYVGSVQGLHVCEVGIGQGFLCDELLKHGATKITAIDVAISYLKELIRKSKVEPYLANAETLPFSEEFDLVVSSDVMEHVLNVGSFLYSVNRALKLGGKAAIRVPYREGLLNYSPHVGYRHQFGHLRSFDKDILRIYAKQAGFRLVRLHVDGFSPYMPRPWAMQHLSGRIAIRIIHHIVERYYSHWSEVAKLPKFLLLTFLRPVEIVMVAEKIENIGAE